MTISKNDPKKFQKSCYCRRYIQRQFNKIWRMIETWMFIKSHHWLMQVQNPHRVLKVHAEWRKQNTLDRNYLGSDN